MSCDVLVCHAMCQAVCHARVSQAEYCGPQAGSSQGGGCYMQAAMMGDVLADDPDHPARGSAGGGQPQFSLWK